MQYTSIGDIAHSILMWGHNTRIKSDLARISETLASGRHADLSGHLGGEFTDLASIERSIRSLTAHRTTVRETTTLLETAQIALGTLQDIGSRTAPALISAGNSAHPALLASTSADAAQKLDSIVAALNVRIADRAVFSGNATDRQALINGAHLLAAVKADVAGAVSAQDLIDRVTDWFQAPGGGFDLHAYQGSAQALSPIPVSDTQRVRFETTAKDPALRKTIQSFVMGALVGQMPQLADTQDAALVLRHAGETMLSAQTDIALLRSGIGTLEAYTDAAGARNAGALAGFEIARAALYEADPYRAATEMELAQTQLEAVYTLTARISRLSLSDYLR